MNKGDDAVFGSEDQGAPLGGGAVVGAPFGFFQGCEKAGCGKKDWDEHGGVGGANGDRRWAPRSPIARRGHSLGRAVLENGRKVRPTPMDQERSRG